MKRFLSRRCMRMVLFALAGSLAVVVIAQVFDWTKPEDVFNGDLYNGYKTREVATLDELVQDFQSQQTVYMPIAPPDTNCWGWTQAASPLPTPFNPAAFPKDFIDGLVPAQRNGITVYPVTVWEDPATRERVFYNVDSQEIASVAAPAGYDPRWCLSDLYPDLSARGWSRDYVNWLTLVYDPSHLMIRYDLILDGDLISWVYTRSVHAAWRQQAAQMSLPGGGMALMRLPAADSNIVFEAIARETNGIALTIGYPGTFTNRLELFSCPDLRAAQWALAATNLSTADTNTIFWTDTDTNPAIRFYAAGNADLNADTDPDGDGLTTAREMFLYHTNPTQSDTDGDGLSDWWEVRYGFDPALEVKNGLMAWYKLDEKTGTFIEDSSGNGNHGRLHGNSASFGAVGPSQWALQFAGANDPDGEEDYVAVPDSPALDIVSNITLAAWVYLNETNAVRQPFLEKVNAYYFNTKNGRLYLTLCNVTTDMTASVYLPTNRWLHLAATYNGTHVCLYTNGVLIASTVTNGPIATTGEPLWLGKRAATPTLYLAGLIDEVRIYSVALASNQVAALYLAGSDQDGDGLGNLAECTFGGNPTHTDMDGDGLSDCVEATVYGTDPGVSNTFATISGTNVYVGTGTGTLYTLATPGKFAWPTNSSVTRQVTGDGVTFRADGGTFAVAHVPVGATYYMKSFLDLNGNGRYDPNEPGSMPLESFALPAGGLNNVTTRVEKIRAMRVDLAYEGSDTPNAVRTVVSNAVAWGVNTIYPWAWSYEYGVYWRTTNATLPMTGHGTNDALRLLAQVAHSNGVKVIAWMQPANSFSNAWYAHPEWQARRSDGTNTYRYELQYQSDSIKYLLSPFNTNYVAWFEGVVNEVLDTGVDGVDISETMIDPIWGANMTYDAAATNLFWERYPDGQLGDENWKLLRAEVLTSNTFHRVGGLIHSCSNRYFHVTFSWNAGDDGSLKTANAQIRDDTGLDLHGVLDLPPAARPDAFNVEFLWQNKAAKLQSTNTFNPAWVATATASFVSRARGRAPIVSHVELSQGRYGTDTWPVNTAEFEASLRLAISNSAGADFYDHHQAVVTNAGLSISNVYFHAP